MPYDPNKPASLDQLNYLEFLIGQARVCVDLNSIRTNGEASKAIDELQAQIPIQPGTRSKCKILEKQTGTDRDELYARIRITSMSESGDCSEAQGRLAIKIMNNEEYEVRRVAPDPAPDLADACANLLDIVDAAPPPRPPLPPRRFKAPPVAEEVVVPVAEEVVVPPVPVMRRRLVPPPAPAPVVEAAPEPEVALPLALTECFEPKPCIEYFPDKNPRVHSIPYEEVERLTAGVDMSIGKRVVEALNARGMWIFPHGPKNAWGLAPCEVNVLGLAKPSPLWYGKLGDKYANSDWWSRNWHNEEAARQPPF